MRYVNAPGLLSAASSFNIKNNVAEPDQQCPVLIGSAQLLIMLKHGLMGKKKCPIGLIKTKRMNM